VLDFGGPVLLTPFELTATAERRLGLPAGRLAFSGPFPPVRDAEWQRVLGGALSERMLTETGTLFVDWVDHLVLPRHLVGADLEDRSRN